MLSLKQRVLGVRVDKGRDQRLRHLQERCFGLAFAIGERPHVLVDKAGDQERVDRCNRCRFGRGEDTAVDTAQDDDDQEQAPARIPRGLEHLAPAIPVAFGQVLDLGHHVDGHHQHDTRHQARDHTG